MSNGWVDISECTEGYWLFRDSDVCHAYPIEITATGAVLSTIDNDVSPKCKHAGKAIKLCDINNNGEVCVMAKGSMNQVRDIELDVAYLTNMAVDACLGDDPIDLSEEFYNDDLEEYHGEAIELNAMHEENV